LPRSRLPQRVVGALAGGSGRASRVRYRSKVSTSRFQASKHVGEHCSGFGGCLASWGSGGFCGGGTTGGDGGGAVAQAVTSNASIDSSSRVATELVLSVTGDLLVLSHPSGFNGAVFGLGLEGGGSRLLALGLDLGAKLGDLDPLKLQAPGLHASQDRADRNGHGQGPHSQPSYFGDLTTRTSWTWCRFMSHALRLPYSGARDLVHVPSTCPNHR
jgi:hypothetical protein